MYIPKHFAEADREKIVAFMRHYPFATIINMQGDTPVATHLPFVIAERDEGIVLLSHFAKANEQWKNLVHTTSLVIFSEPHAYISARHYDYEQNVPTWNYIAVHAYGKARLIEDEDGKLQLLEKTIRSFEARFQQQWDGLTDKFRTGVMSGIVGFEIEITDLQAKYKLSQNRSGAEKEKIISELSKSNDAAAISVANYMKEL